MMHQSCETPFHLSVVYHFEALRWALTCCCYHFQAMRWALTDVVLPKYKIQEYFMVHVDNILQQFRTSILCK